MKIIVEIKNYTRPHDIDAKTVSCCPLESYHHTSNRVIIIKNKRNLPYESKRGTKEGVKIQVE